MRIADCTARFMARRNATRRSSCCAMPSATSVASISGLRTSTMLRCTSESVSAGKLAAELLDIGALLADQNAGPRGVHGDAALLVRALDHHLGDAGLLARLEDMLAHLQVFVQQPRIFAARRDTSANPRCG